jgi:enamine deaminase RidA (YjgF/YER057c/UK114 family)
MAIREVITVPNAPKHGENPIPICVKIGNLVFPSVINGRDPKQPGLSDEPNKQIAQAFINMRNIIEAAGGTTDSIAKVTVYLKDFKHRELVNNEWVAMFPNEDNRPARHTMTSDLRGKTLIQLDVMAVL